MSLTYLPASIVNAQVEAAYPSSSITRSVTATNGTTTLTVSVSDSFSIQVGMAVAGAGITSGGLVTAVNNATGVITISGTITTLTASVYTFTQSLFASLHTASPSTTGANEVSGGSYARQSLTDGAPSSGVKSSTNAQNWTSMPSVTITHDGAWSASSSGTYCGGGPLGSSLTVPLNATVSAAIGAITITSGG